MMIAFLNAAVLLFTPSAGAAPEAVFSELSFDQACAAADEKNELVLVYFYEVDNEQCEAYGGLTWQKSEVATWLTEHVTAIAVDAKRNAALCKRFNVRVSPTVLLVSPDGTLQTRIVGFHEAQSLLGELEAAVAASDPLAMARRRVEAAKENPAAILAYARALEESERLDEALQQYIRCFEQDAAQSRGFGGIQLVVLEELGRLAKEYPPARAALVDRRDASRKRLLAGKNLRTDPAVFAAANTHLHELGDTLLVYGKLQESKSTSLATRLLRECAVDSALKLREYDRIVELIDVAEHARRAYRRYQNDLSKSVPSGVDYDRFRALEHSAFVERGVRFYEMLSGAGRHDEAATVASIVLKVDEGAETYLALARTGLRMSRPTEADVGHARKAVELCEAPNPDTLSTLVELLLRLGRHEEASSIITEYAPKLGDPQARNELEELLGPRDKTETRR